MMPRLKYVRRTSTIPPDACLFCRSEEDNEEVYGKLLKKKGITVHYFCMLFSSGLWQRGKKERDGILGFMPADIFTEQRRGSRLTCQYCKQKGATIGCVVTNCRKTFHFRCGREAGGLSQFFQQFRSYCPDHRPCQETHTSDRLAFYGTAKSTCSICMLAVEARASNYTLRSPCCRKSWFHRSCIQRYARSAGAYFFKCPLCNNKDLFETEMLEFGIYIPEQDAAWEQDPSAFQDLLERYSRCDVDPCKCPQGPQYSGPLGSRWELLLCEWCGSSGTHKSCQGLVKVGKESLCTECAQMNIVTAEDENGSEAKKKRKDPRSPPSEVEVRRHLESRLASSLRAQRASRRRNNSSPSPPSSSPPQPPPPPLPPAQAVKAGRRGRGGKTGNKELSTAAELLKDSRLTRSMPFVCVERSLTRGRGKDMRGLSSSHSLSSLSPSDSSSSGSLVGGSGGSRSNGWEGSLESWPEKEATRVCSDEMDSAAPGSGQEKGADAWQPVLVCWHGIPRVPEGATAAHSQAASPQAQGTEPVCSKSCLAQPSTEGPTPHSLQCDGGSQRLQHTVQCKESCIPHDTLEDDKEKYDELCGMEHSKDDAHKVQDNVDFKGSHKMVEYKDADKSYNMDHLKGVHTLTPPASDQTDLSAWAHSVQLLPLEKRAEAADSEPIVDKAVIICAGNTAPCTPQPQQKGKRTYPARLIRMTHTPLMVNSRSSRRSISRDITSTASNGQRVTRSQSMTSKVMTQRASSQQSSAKKRPRPTSAQHRDTRSGRRGSRASLSVAGGGVGTDSLHGQRESCLQHNITVGWAQGHGQRVHGRWCGDSVGEEKPWESSSDGNNNLSGDNTTLQQSNQSSPSPRRSVRSSHTALVHSPLVGLQLNNASSPKKTSNPSKNLSSCKTSSPYKTLSTSKIFSPSKTSSPSNSCSPSKTSSSSKNLSTSKTSSPYKTLSTSKTFSTTKTSSLNKTCNPSNLCSPSKTSSPSKNSNPCKTFSPVKTSSPYKKCRHVCEDGDGEQEAAVEQAREDSTVPCKKAKTQPGITFAHPEPMAQLSELDKVLTENRQELKSIHQHQIERLQQEQDTALRRMKLVMQEKACSI